MKWIKDNGQEIETNDREVTIDYCKSLGWTPATEAKPSEDKPAVKRGRPKKAE
jgi:hypothetical protein